MPNPTQRSILIVEDHGQTSAVMARLVRARGYEVITASSIAEAREHAGQGVIGFLISDLGLPDGNGCDLMTELQASLGIKGAAISGFGMEGDVERSHRAGFALHLTKPIRMADLDQVLALAKTEIEKAGTDDPSANASRK